MRSKDVESFAAVIENEKFRISARDAQLLRTELNWITTQSSLRVPFFQNLDEYCGWLSPRKPKTVKWDLLRHYTSGETAAYLPIYQKNKGTISKPHHKDYNDRLLAHSLNGKYWQQAKENGFLPGHPMICFSSGQVVFKGSAIDGMYSMTVIFDRQLLEKVYTLQPYSDHEVEWEKEVRAYEPISLDLAVGYIPTEKFLLELDHWGQLTCVCGKRTMADLERHYLNTGHLMAVD